MRGSAQLYRFAALLFATRPCAAQRDASAGRLMAADDAGMTPRHWPTPAPYEFPAALRMIFSFSAEKEAARRVSADAALIISLPPLMTRISFVTPALPRLLKIWRVTLSLWRGRGARLHELRHYRRVAFSMPDYGLMSFQDIWRPLRFDGDGHDIFCRSPALLMQGAPMRFCRGAFNILR